MFEGIQRLNHELGGLQTKAQNIPNAKLQSEVKAFVENVSREVELAFRDVFNILREIAELPGDRVNQDKVTGLQQKLVNTYAKDEFKNVKKICERLDECSKRYAAEIEPHLRNHPYGPDSHSELFWLLNKHEGAFIYTIKNAVHEISDSLAAFEHPEDYRTIRSQALSAQLELGDILDEVQSAVVKHNASLSPISDLLRDGQEADRVLRNSPLFSLACYVGAFLIVLSALSVMAANVKPWTIPLIIAATYAFVVTLGAFQLRNDGKLGEKPFISLVEFSATRVLIPFLKRKVPGDKD